MSVILKVNSEISLRQLQSSDANVIYKTIDLQREYLRQWLPFVSATTKMMDTEDFIQRVVDAPVESFEYIFTIHFQNTFAGLIGFKDTDRLNKKTEIGYWLSQGFQKKGIVSACLDKLCAWSFEELGMNRVQVKCAVGNLRSRRIPERLGFELEGVERDGELLSNNTFTDLATYALLKRDVV